MRFSGKRRDCTSECPTSEADTLLPVEHVIEVVEGLRSTRGLPETILAADDGPEFTSHAFDRWCRHRS
jgi:hypothetical protein